MGGLSNWPDFQGFIASCWGSPSFQGGSTYAFLNGASNVVVGTNPGYSITDFAAFYPAFLGPPVQLNGTFTVDSPDVTGIIVPPVATAPNCLLPPTVASGQLIVGVGIPPGTTIVSAQAVSSGISITLSQNATINGSSPFQVFTNPMVPLFVINTYIVAASKALVQARWLDMWTLGMAYYVAHFITLYRRSQGDENTPLGAVAVAGLKQGITVAGAAGGVSQSTQPVPGNDDWGAWNQTQFGVLLVEQAKTIGAGPMWLY